jgi:hypothetical protein
VFGLFFRILIWPVRLVVSLIFSAVSRALRSLLVIAIVLGVIGYGGLVGYRWAENTQFDSTKTW